MLEKRFENEDQAFRIRKNGWSAAIAIGTIGIILLFLFWWVITTPNPPFPENMGGVAINFGNSEVGSGDEQPMTYTPIETQAAEASTSPTNTETASNLMTQDIDDAPVLEEKKDKPVIKPVSQPVSTPVSNVNKPVSKPVENPKPAVDQNSMFNPGAIGKPNNSKGDGEGGGKGDQGDPNGDPNSKSYQGNGSGDGIGNGSGSGIGDGNVKLSGRSTRVKAKPDYNCSAKGKVNIEIKVDRNGNVIDAKFLQLGSTTSDACLVREAVSTAKRFKFNESSTAGDIQTGSILFTFKVQ